MKKLFICFFTAVCLTALGAESSAAAFFNILRDSSARNGSTYGVLEGTATHIRREKGRKIVEEYPCFMAVIITPGRSITQIILDNSEGYLIGRVQNESTSIRRLSKKNGIMERIGVSPRDLSMSFLDSKFIRELPQETLRMVGCRVLLLHDQKQKEWIKIYAAKEYYFVLKAEFFTSEPDAKSIPSRTLEVNSFAQKNNLYYTRSIEVSGPGWRTDIAFDKADMNIYKAEQGTGIFRNLK